MYLRTCSNSKPTVATAYPRAQKCSPVKFRSLPHKRAIAMALSPFKNPIIEATGYFGGIAMHMCTWSGSSNSNELAFDRFPTRHPPFMVLTKPWGGCYAGTVKPLRVSLVEPVAYLKSELVRQSSQNAVRILDPRDGQMRHSLAHQSRRIEQILCRNRQ